MAWSFSIGRIFGSDLRVHVTFFLLLAWIGAAAYAEGGWGAAAGSVLFIITIFACVVLHEFGHALAARRYGIRTPDVTLLPIGGLARLERMPENPREEIVVALAGPAVNVVIWLVLSLLLGARASMSGLENLADPNESFLGRVATVNLALVLFNMVPAFPMDGGRVLRAALALRMDRVRATRLAAQLGQGLAFVFGFLGLTYGNPMLMLVGVFVFMAASAESGDTAMHELAKNLLARDAMITRYEALAPDDSLEAAGQALIHTTQHEFPVREAGGNTVGFLMREAIFGADGGRAAVQKVSELMQIDFPKVLLTDPLERALQALGDGQVRVVGVTDARGHMVGYITRENIGELMVLAQKNRGPRNAR